MEITCKFKFDDFNDRRPVMLLLYSFKLPNRLLSATVAVFGIERPDRPFHKFRSLKSFLNYEFRWSPNLEGFEIVNGPVGKWVTWQDSTHMTGLLPLPTTLLQLLLMLLETNSTTCISGKNTRARIYISLLLSCSCHVYNLLDKCNFITTEQYPSKVGQARPKRFSFFRGRLLPFVFFLARKCFMTFEGCI